MRMLNEEISAEAVAACIADLMPEIEQRFKKLGHRQIRVNLFVESLDDLAPCTTTDTPVAMVCLYSQRLT